MTRAFTGDLTGDLLNDPLLAAFNSYYNDLESFFYQDQLELVDITPLHHFKYLSLLGNRLVPTKIPITLSKQLRIVPVTKEHKIRLWNRFPISRIDRSNDEIDYIFEYDFNADKYSRSEIQIDTRLVFSTIVTLFRLVGVDCGVYDRITITRLDLPIYLLGLNFSVASLGVLPTLDNFKKLWNDYGDPLLKKVFDNKRFEGDPFANLKISIGRFNDAFERKDGTDAFIDNVVALEALFSKEDDPYQGITLRLARRIALFLESEPQKRKETFCEMVRLYDSRGKIIHGGYTEAIDIVKTRDYLIRSYLKYFGFLKRDSFSHLVDFIEPLDIDAKNLTMNRNNCNRVKHTHNDEYVFTSPDLLFT
jgi:Apea-like HEPN